MDREWIRETLFALDAIPGVSGFEDAVGEAIAQYMRGACDETWRDALGNRLFLRRGKRADKTIFLCAHMDEIGFMVSDIDDAGYVYVVPVGFHDFRLQHGQLFTIHTASGAIPASTGAGRPPHELKGSEPPALRYEDLRLDVGAFSRRQALKMGIAPGDTVTNERGCRMLGRDVFCGKAADNRAGCTALLAAMHLLAGSELQPTVVACASVQEELGVKGVRCAAAAVSPQLALSFDVCFAAVTDAVTPGHTRAYLGRGPALQAFDWSPGSLLGNVVPPALRRGLARAARRARIPFQTEVTLDGGTDAAEIALIGAGVAAGGINIPNRYMHTAVSCVHLDDVYNAARLAANYINGLDVEHDFP